jgi:E3 ubiquitin-protein ligase RNF139
LKDFFVKAFLIKYVVMYVTSDFIICTYEFVDSGILTFSALPTSKPLRHIRGLSMYVCFLVVSIYTMYNTQEYHNTFIFIPLIITCLSTCLQSVSSILIYLLFVYDGVFPHPLENLDDIVFYIRSTVQFCDFVGSLIVAGRGIWIIKSGTFRWIEIPFFILYCYDKIWERLHGAWKKFLLRKDAMKKLNALKTATREKIQDYDDVCSICIRQMSSAKITPCGHLFHETCLKKWIYVRDSCPLCNKKVYVYSISPNKTL